MRLLDYTDTYQLKENKKDISGFTQDICKRKPFDEVSGKITINDLSMTFSLLLPLTFRLVYHVGIFLF